MESLFLIGMMGCGKTTLGRQLARTRGWDFLDFDAEIEQRTGVSVRHIFDVEGEAGFRDRETALLREFVGREHAVFATGGGIVLRPENRELLRTGGRVVYLHVTPRELALRLKQDTRRPLLQVADREAVIESLYQLRDPLYRETAHLVVALGGRSARHSVELIERGLSACQPS